MSEHTFLAKLYEIKPFKIVDSPQNAKNENKITFDTHQVQNPPLLSLQYIPSSQSHNFHHTFSSTPLKALPNNIAKSSPPLQNHDSLKKENNLKLQQKSCAKRSLISSQQPTTLTNCQNSKPPMNLLTKSSPIRTPNKQNILPMGVMIQSHLYTSLSSSIDNLFSKIQKIKQQFEQNSTGKNKSNNNKNCLNMSKENPKEKFKIANIEDESEISSYSPIIKHCMSQDFGNGSMQSSMSSLNPLINNINYAVMNNPKRNLQSNQMQNQVESINSFQLLPPLLATHNIEEISNKTRSIIDQINLLLQSSKKNNQTSTPFNFQISNQIDESKNKIKCRKMKSYQENPILYNQNPPLCNIQQDFGNTYENFDELDDEFMMIKLKSTQSEYAPSLAHKNSMSSNTNCGSKKQFCLDNEQLGFKIEQPAYSVSNPCIKQESSQNISIEVQPDNFSHSSEQKRPKYKTKLSMRSFELGKCVGSGKFGDVHICRHKETGSIFALKKIFKSTIVEYNMVQQFSRQLKIHYMLSHNHQNITKLYSHFEDEYHIFLLMEYMEDGTLMEHLKQTQEYVSNIILQVLNAVQYLHRNNIAHRDIKPQNILLTNGVVKLCDFGWSSEFTDQMKRTFCGTLDYISPQMKDRGQYTTSVDLWSIGVLTFEMLAGFAPYKKEIDKWKLMGGRIKDKWKWDVIYPPFISDCAKNFIQGLLKQNPDERLSIRECKNHDFILSYIDKTPQYLLYEENSKLFS